METKTITSTAIWYHISSAKGDSASRWAKGAARKGIYNGQSSLSMILFDAETIREAIGTDFLQEADLVISRDSAYGTDPVTVCVAPAYITDMGETYMSRSECIGMARRKMHKCHVVEGDTATFHIPGATLKAIWGEEVNAFLLYQEKDGTDSYCKFGDGAELKLKLGDDAPAAPVWTRTISAGDTICSEIYSHLADLREIEYYIALRNKNLIFAQSMQDYGGWSLYINMMRELAETFLEEEGRTYNWIPIPEGREIWNAWDSPNADVLNNLRGVLRGTDETRIEANAFGASQLTTSAKEKFNERASMSWSEQASASAGVVKRSEYSGSGQSTQTVTVWHMHVCGWIFQMAGTATSAGIELTVKAADTTKPMVRLYAIKVNEVPNSATYNQVFDSVLIGEKQCAVNETTVIPLNAQGLAKLNDRTMHGIGIRYDNEYIALDRIAALVINQEGE